MSWVVSALGAAVVAAVLRDIFHTLFHPSGHGDLSRFVMRGIWRLSRYRGGRHRVAALAGPMAMVAVIGMWTGLVVLGWTLIYWLHLADGFVFSTDLPPERRGGLLDALYVSLVTVATLGLGDIVPVDPWLRLAAPLQALVGFVLLTAAVSWVLQIYPALARRRILTGRLALLRRTSTIASIHDLDSSLATHLLSGLADEFVTARIDLTQYAETYYFRDRDPEMSLAAMLGHAADLSRGGARSARRDVRLAGALLECALEDFARLLDEQFLHTGGTTSEVFEAYAADHGHAGTRRTP